MVRRHAALAALALGTLAACTPDDPVGPAADPSLSIGGAAPRQHLVVFKSAAPADFAARVAALGGTVVASMDQIGVVSVAGLSDDAAGHLATSDGVDAVGVDEEAELDAPVFVEEPESVDGAVADEAQGPTNPHAAFFFPRQWHLRQIGAHRAWAAGKLGSPTTKVFILDTGIDPTHPDLVGRVDASLSRSFIPGDDAFLNAHPDPYFRNAPKFADLHFHGTHVGATVSSNALVAAGVTSRVTLVGVKVLGRNGRSFGSSVIRGLLYAADNDADVVNMSLGGGFFRTGNGAVLRTINRTMSYVQRQGTLVVVAAGNNNLDLQHMNRYSVGTTRTANYYATYCDASNVVCVSATGPTARAGVNGPWTAPDTRASYSNYGNKIFVAAPGGNGLSSVTAACSKFVASGFLTICRAGNFAVGSNGTSMATPHVAGLAALLVDVVGRNNPAQLRAALKAASDDLGAPERDPIYGHGRINVAKAFGL